MTEQEELQQRIEAQAKQEQVKKGKTKKKGKQDSIIESTVVIDPDQSEDIQINLPSPITTMPRGNRGHVI